MTECKTENEIPVEGLSQESPPREPNILTENDIFLFNQGNHFRIYERMGAHPMEIDGSKGTYFAVWAPNAQRVSVVGDFNNWNKTTHFLHLKENTGIWEGFIPSVHKGSRYKYYIVSRYNNYCIEKSDPLAFYNEVPPAKASIIWDLEYVWKDQEWMSSRARYNGTTAPISIYEVHIGSWMRVPDEANRFLTYRELAVKLAEYARSMGFTHIEFLPVMEHPFYGSWGYQVTGYFAPSARYGTPQDFMHLIDYLHQQGIGVILDWVPSHFTTDEYGLGYFDGTHLYEHSDPRQGRHPEWNSFIFNYDRNEVRSFLISNALFWLGVYHADGLRVDAVASMLYLDYARKPGEWIANKYGGKENLGAIFFLRSFNENVYKNYPDIQTIAEDSTAWPMVSRPTYVGGLGFGMKWDMGWMHDMLEYMRKDPIFRKHHHNLLTFRLIYAFQENLVLSLSHDEVVHGKGSLLGKMPGDEWQKFANLRVLFGYMCAQPGKKTLFMGDEFGQAREWNHDQSLDWHVLQYAKHSGLQRLVKDLNRLYHREEALHKFDFSPEGFEWIDCNNSQQSVVSFIRKTQEPGVMIIVICNFTPMTLFNYRVGVPYGGVWEEILNSDAVEYGGSGNCNSGRIEAEAISFHGRPYSINITLSALAALFFKQIEPDMKEEIEEPGVI